MMKPKKKRTVKATALAALAESLNISTFSEDFCKLEETLNQFSIGDASDTMEAQKQCEPDDDISVGLCTPTDSQINEPQCPAVSPKEGNTFAICGGCANMALLSAGEFSAPFGTEHCPELYNVTVFTFCKACQRSGRASNKLETYSKLSHALFSQSRVATIPAMIMGEAVPILSDGDFVRFVAFDEIMKRVGPDVKAFGIRTDFKSKDPPASLLLTYLPGRFL